MKILHLLASPRGMDANCAWLAQRIVDHVVRDAGAKVAVDIILRDLHADRIPHVDADYADALGSPQPRSDEDQAGGALALSDILIRELDAADVVVIGTPMHNYTVPSTLKAWIDHVVRVRRTFAITPDGKAGLLRDRPVFIAVASGGRFSGPGARQPDFLTPYLKVALGTIGLHDLRCYSMEGLAAGEAAVHVEQERIAVVLEAAFSRAG